MTLQVTFGKTSTNAREIQASLRQLRGTRVTVFGDFCLDAYWMIDEAERELSLETGLPLRRVREQRYSLGGAGNVVANLVSLGVEVVHAVGVAGFDVFGPRMVDLLQRCGAQIDGFLLSEGWQTMVYAKPCIGRSESNRIDFGAFNALNDKDLDALAVQLEAVARQSDVVILNQQVPCGVMTDRMMQRVNDLIAALPEVIFVVDARNRAEEFAPAVLKLNSMEASRCLGQAYDQEVSLDRALQQVHELQQRTGKPAFVTRGIEGIVFAAGDEVGHVPGIPIFGEVDTVGAGDTAVSALAATLGSGQSARRAAELANLAAMVTVKKIHTTGTASPEEILQVAEDHARGMH